MDPSSKHVVDELVATPRSRPREREQSATLVIDRRRRAKIRVRGRNGMRELRLPQRQLDRLLEPALRIDTRAKLARHADAEGYIAVTALRAQGLAVHFDRSKRVLYVEIPPEIRRIEVISLWMDELAHESVTEVSPSTLSGFVNLRGVTDYVETALPQEDTGRRPARIEIDAAGNYDDWVLESRLAFLEESEHAWQRGETRLVRDFPERSTRLEAGDLSLPIAGFQNRRPMAGLSFGTQFDLQPDRAFQPAGTREFVLDRPSVVDVYVNGQPTRNLRLLPGRYDVRDFRFGNGVNDVRIRIEDDLGRVRDLDFGFAFEPALLAQGKHQFSYSLGFPSVANGDLGGYERERTTLSGFHRYGLGPALTVGANLQADVDQWLAGLEATWAGTWGSVRADAALAHADDRGADLAARASYEYFDQTPANRWRRRIAFGIESRGVEFASIGTAPATSPAVELRASMSQDLFSSTLHGSLDGRYTIGRGRVPDEALVALTLQKPVSSWLQIDLTLERSWSPAGAGGLRSLVSVAWTGAPPNHSLRMGHDSADHSTQLDWSYLPVDQVGGFGANARFTRRPLQNDASGNLIYTGRRMDTELRHDASFETRSGDGTQHRTTLRFGTALAYAGGRVAVSRPITQSFALVVPGPALTGGAFGVDGASAVSLAADDRLGPAVLTDLIPYQVRPIHIKASNLPPGIRLGETHFNARPTYKSGIVIPLAADSVAVAHGFLVGSDGAPVAMTSGVLRRLDDSDASARMIFTNRRGFFRCPDLRPGDYELRLSYAIHLPLRFSVPAGAIGELDLGQIELAAALAPSPVEHWPSIGARAPTPALPAYAPTPSSVEIADSAR